MWIQEAEFLRTLLRLHICFKNKCWKCALNLVVVHKFCKRTCFKIDDYVYQHGYKDTTYHLKAPLHNVHLSRENVLGWMSCVPASRQRMNVMCPSKHTADECLVSQQVDSGWMSCVPASRQRMNVMCPSKQTADECHVSQQADCGS